MLGSIRDNPDLMMVDGPIYSPGPNREAADALAVIDGKIAAVGSTEEIRPSAGPETRVVSLAGRSAIPGIIDSHNHLLTAGSHMADGILLFDVTSIDELKRRVADRAAEIGPGRWITGAGWIENQFAEWRAPTRRDLDEAAPRNPVVLDRLFAASAVNTLALEAAGIDRGNAPGERGVVECDSKGRPTGILRDGAQVPVHRAASDAGVGRTLEDMARYIETAAREYIRWGITSVVDPGVTPRGLRAYQMCLLRGCLPLRVNAMPAWHGLRPEMEKELEGRVDHLGMFTGFGNENLRLGALKMALDGGLGSRSSWMYEPFIDGGCSTTPLRFSPGDIDRFFSEGAGAGWSIGIHCCGDRAQDTACAAFDRLPRTRLAGPVRHNIIHGYFPTEYSLELMARRDIAVSAQPGFIWVEGDLYETVLKPDRLHDFKPLRTYRDRGIRVAINSDMTSAHYNPFWGLHSAVTRKTARGKRLGRRECVDRFEGLEMMTAAGAYLCGEEDTKGTLVPGMLADIAVLDRDFAAVSDDELRDLEVDMTIVGGKVVFDGEAASCGG